VTALPDVSAGLTARPAPTGTTAGPWRRTFLAVLLAVVDLGLIQAVFQDGMPVERAIAAHSIVVLALGMMCVLLVPREAFAHALRLLLLLLSGPLGGPTMLAGLIAAQLLGTLKPARVARRVHADDRPQSERLLDDIRQNRRRQPGTMATVPMTWTMAYGTDRQRYALLGVIARRYTPEMRPALDMALKSPDPALRVQSASVYAKLRNRFAGRAAALIDKHTWLWMHDASPAETARVIVEIRKVVRSEFLEDGLRARLEEILVEDEMLFRNPEGKRAAHADAAGATDAGATDAGAADAGPADLEIAGS